MFISRPMLTFAQPYKVYNSKHLPAVSSYMGGLVFHVKAVLGLRQEAALAVIANGGEKCSPVPKSVVLMRGLLVGCLDFISGVLPVPWCLHMQVKPKTPLTFEMRKGI